ncbi:hypothetical protein GCM10027598_59770 [Amycolatopsis oliviviridis]|uniref:PABC domain-containing protein n=1 Tax=Amycolatopsis oliviviridis TaxID=1471590 RepID=A0ABQ3LXQ7_9PSEU|nr:hypothetical protein [Amycolatopsis oliviviridis]GHH28875.1 hypothetical protein GCM10017790_60420 [Amycolatopsis oliviviridis]
MPPDNRENCLSAEELAELNPQQRKARLGQVLLPLVQEHQPILAVHVTKALLELEDDEVLALLENRSRLERKIEDATAELARQDELTRRAGLRRHTDG